jgi:nucleotide-binding universal stress UspA family protein
LAVAAKPQQLTLITEIESRALESPAWQSEKVPSHESIVPVDGSPGSIRALRHAIEQAKRQRGGSLLVMNVQNRSTLGLADSAGLMPPAWIEQEEARASQELLEEPASICAQAGVTYSARAERGAIASTIDRVAREEHVD